jgi:hypothetical protein
MRTGTMRNRLWLQEARMSFLWNLVLSTHSACGDEGKDVRDHCGHEVGRIVSEVKGVAEELYRRERASGFTFLDPGR